MSPEKRPPVQELPVQREKLEKLWQNAWKFIERTVKHPTDERKFIAKEGRLIEIESSYDLDSLGMIAVRSWNLSLPTPGESRPWEPRLLRLEAEVVVNNPGGSESPSGFESESYAFNGKVSSDWVESVDFAISRLLEYQYLPQTS